MEKPRSKEYRNFEVFPFYEIQWRQFRIIGSYGGPAARVRATPTSESCSVNVTLHFAVDAHIYIHRQPQETENNSQSIVSTAVWNRSDCGLLLRKTATEESLPARRSKPKGARSHF